MTLSPLSACLFSILWHSNWEALSWMYGMHLLHLHVTAVIAPVSIATCLCCWYSLLWSIVLVTVINLWKGYNLKLFAVEDVCGNLVPDVYWGITVTQVCVLGVHSCIMPASMMFTTLTVWSICNCSSSASPEGPTHSYPIDIIALYIVKIHPSFRALP